jgi:transcriptional regulator with XRE-family HTH domain
MTGRAEAPIDPMIQALRQRRIELGLSQGALNRRMGGSSANIHRWEAEQNSPSWFMMRCWAQALDCELKLIELSG